MPAELIPIRPPHVELKKIRSLVLEKQGILKIRDCDVNDYLGDDDVRIKPHTVGICGSDAHYYMHGHIGQYIVKDPMIMGHEASGTIIATGKNVKHLKVGDRVCMEPGIPDWHSKQTLKGIYNLDPRICFFATPPVDGCMSDTIIHPASLTFKLPDNVSFSEGAMVEPLAVGLHSALLAGIKPGDVALVYGAGTIGILTALCALNGGCSSVIITDPKQGRLEISSHYNGIIPVLSGDREKLEKTVNELTENDGVDIVFECSGAKQAIHDVFTFACPGGTVVLVGMPPESTTIDTVAAQSKELTIKTVFRYRNVYPRCVRMLASKKINVRPLITAKFKFEDSVKAYERCTEARPTDIKIHIVMGTEPDLPSKM